MTIQVITTKSISDQDSVRKYLLKTLKFKETTSKSFGYVYAISTENRVKIGKTKEPAARLANITMQGGLCLEKAFISIPCSNYSEIENLAHKHFSYKKIIGEWFDITIEQATTFIENSYFESKPIYKKEANSECLLNLLTEDSFNQLYSRCRGYLIALKKYDAVLSMFLGCIENKNDAVFDSKSMTAVTLVNNKIHYILGMILSAVDIKRKSTGYNTNNALCAAIYKRYETENISFHENDIKSLLQESYEFANNGIEF